MSAAFSKYYKILRKIIKKILKKIIKWLDGWKEGRMEGWTLGLMHLIILFPPQTNHMIKCAA